MPDQYNPAGEAVSVIAMIPARYAATRFPGKLMQMLGEKTVIRHTYDNTKAAGVFDEVIVVTDSNLIYNEIMDNGGNAMMSIKDHQSGSDRIAEAVADMNVDIIVNVQGDEPFVTKEVLQKLVHAFDTPSGKDVQVASVMQRIHEEEQVIDPNVVKVVVDKYSNALYFSRCGIPFLRDKKAQIVYYKHIGVYAFRKHALLDFTHWPASALELTEKLEQLRYLENGVKIKMVQSDFSGVGIDTPQDLAKAQEILRR